MGSTFQTRETGFKGSDRGNLISVIKEQEDWFSQNGGSSGESGKRCHQIGNGEEEHQIGNGEKGPTGLSVK